MANIVLVSSGNPAPKTPAPAKPSPFIPIPTDPLKLIAKPHEPKRTFTWEDEDFAEPKDTKSSSGSSPATPPPAPIEEVKPKAGISIKTVAALFKSVFSRVGSFVDTFLKDGKLKTALQINVPMDPENSIALTSSAEVGNNQGNVKAKLALPGGISCKVQLPISEAGQDVTSVYTNFFKKMEPLLNSSKPESVKAPAIVVAKPKLNFTIQTIMRLAKSILPKMDWLVDLFQKHGKVEASVEGKAPLDATSSLEFSAKTLLSEKQGSVNAKFTLSGGLSCEISLMVPPSAQKEDAAILLHSKFYTKLKEMLQPHLSTMSQLELTEADVIHLILSVPSQVHRLTWEGDRGQAILSIQLPGDGNLSVVITSPKGKNYGEAFDGLPEFVKAMLKQHLKELFPIVKPLLTQSFNFIWDGTESKFKLSFLRQQMVVLKALKLKATGALAAIGEFLSSNTQIILPERISGKVNFSLLTIDFAESPLTVTVNKKMVPRMDITLKKVTYQPISNAVVLEYKAPIKGNGKEIIDLNTSNIEKIDLEFKTL